jgi:arginyl-tRNA synthetase
MRQFDDEDLLDLLERRIAGAEAEDELTLIVPQQPVKARDATLVVRRPLWKVSSAGSAAVASILEAGELEVVRSARRRIHLRISDELLKPIAVRLEERTWDPLRTRDLHRGASWTINFVDPNATKALHIGHLRNIAVGHSLASVAQAGGVSVVRQVRVGDYGRNIGEAMVGYLAYGEGRRPESGGVRGDRLVGECYARYVSTLTPDQETTEADAALTREALVARDQADHLLARWRAGDPEQVHLFEDLRQWVLDGHESTYDKLGVTVDRTLLESDQLDHAEALVQWGLATGVFRQAENGAIVYETGDPGYEQFLLVRQDGFPTQHLRYIATWSSTRDLYDEGHTICVSGSEWVHLVKYTERIIRELHPPGERHPKSDVIYEMVTSDSGVIKSSKGDAPLIDDILDEIGACDQAKELQGLNPRVTAEEIATIVALSQFLAQPANRRMKIGGEAFTRPGGAGWELAQAWAHAWDPAHDGPPDPDLDDRDYRFLLIRSSLHRRLLANSVADEQVWALMRFHMHLAKWFLGTRPNARLARAMRSVLGEGLVALGLHRSGAPSGVDESMEPRKA